MDATINSWENETILECAKELEENQLSRPIKWWFFGNRYANPWSTWRSFYNPKKIFSLIKWKFYKWCRYCCCCTGPSEGILSNDELDKQLPVLSKDQILKEIMTVQDNGQGGAKDQVKATWLGHASVLFQIGGVNILCDPVFSDTVGPSTGLLKAFAFKRYRRAPLQVEDLPEIHAVVISHDHHDHTDEASIRELVKKFPDIKWFVPIGLKAWMEKIIATTLDEAQDESAASFDAGNIVELTWWENSTTFFGPSENGAGEQKLIFTFTPSQHWGGRSLTAMNTVLWGSWVISSKSLKVWFGGDTGYCEAFEEIGRVIGNIDLAAIPIGAYWPRGVMKDQHVEPSESIEIHKNIKARKSIAIHWGTFNTGAIEGHMDPKNHLKEGLKRAGVSDKDFVTLHHGESITVDALDVQDSDALTVSQTTSPTITPIVMRNLMGASASPSINSVWSFRRSV